MHKALMILATVFLSGVTAVADDIVVYRGTARLAVDAETATAIAGRASLYYVVNYTNPSVLQILYFKKLSKKMSAGLTPVRITRGTMPGSKAATILVAGSVTDTAEDDFFFSVFVGRGRDVALLIETQPSRRTIERPRTFAGKSLFVEAEPLETTRFQDATINLAIDVPKTISANNEDKTLETVRDEIVAALMAQGYQLP